LNFFTKNIIFNHFLKLIIVQSYMTQIKLLKLKMKSLWLLSTLFLKRCQS